MVLRCLTVCAVAFFLATSIIRADEPDADKVLDRFVGAWKNDIARKDPEAPQGRKLTSDEVVAKSLKGRFLIGREMNPKSDVKFMWFMARDLDGKGYTLTYFNTKGLLGTEWKGTWDEASGTLTSKSSDAPASWSSEAVNRFVGKDKVEANAWMKNDKGESIFDMSLTKTRQPAEAGEKILAAWADDAKPDAELSAELKVLDRLAGTWDVTALSKKAEWTPEDMTIKSKVTRSWVLNRTFLQDISSSDDGTESIALITYDAKRKEYRSWWFSSPGYTSKSTGQWDAASQTLRTTSTLPDGQTSAGSVQFTDNDHHVWKVLITDAGGKVYFDCEWKCVRAKP